MITLAIDWVGNLGETQLKIIKMLLQMEHDNLRKYFSCLCPEERGDSSDFHIVCADYLTNVTYWEIYVPFGDAELMSKTFDSLEKICKFTHSSTTEQVSVRGLLADFSNALVDTSNYIVNIQPHNSLFLIEDNVVASSCKSSVGAAGVDVSALPILQNKVLDQNT